MDSLTISSQLVLTSTTFSKMYHFVTKIVPECRCAVKLYSNSAVSDNINKSFAYNKHETVSSNLGEWQSCVEK